MSHPPTTTQSPKLEQLEYSREFQPKGQFTATSRAREPRQERSGLDVLTRPVLGAFPPKRPLSRPRVVLFVAISLEWLEHPRCPVNRSNDASPRPDYRVYRVERREAA